MNEDEKALLLALQETLSRFPQVPNVRVVKMLAQGSGSCAVAEGYSRKQFVKLAANVWDQCAEQLPAAMRAIKGSN